MQLDVIETFLDLCETRNFRRTAERLGVTQSTVSGRLKALEAAVGRPLFTRSRSGAELTTEGMQFEPHARSLRRGWAEALHAVRHSGGAAVTLRIGIQHDLAADHIGDWLAGFRASLPDTAFYVEADYSAQMCADLISGSLDLGVMYSPRAHPDLHVEQTGEVTYRMVSTEVDRLADVRPERYVRANFSPAFQRQHDALLPGLASAPLGSGLTAAVAGLVVGSGGTGYVLERTAEALAATGRCRPVADAPPIQQTVHGAVHVRDRHRPMQRRLLAVVGSHFGRIPAAGRPLAGRRQP